MLKILRAHGIQGKTIDACHWRYVYEKIMAKGISPGGETDLSEILAGVLQGDILKFAPCLLYSTRFCPENCYRKKY